MVPFTTSGIAFRQNVGEWVFWYQHIWFGILGPSWFFQIASPAKLCEFGIRVSLIVRPLLLIIILITASLSSKKLKQGVEEKKFCVWCDVVNICPTNVSRRVGLFLRSFAGKFSPRLWRNRLLRGVDWLEEECNTSITKSQRSRAGRPSPCVGLHLRLSSQTRNLCVSEVCFLHIQLMGANVRLPKIHRIPPPLTEVDLESSKSAAKSESWNSHNLQCGVLYLVSTWQYCLYSLVFWMSEIKRAKRLSHALVHFVTPRASLFTDHWMSGLPNACQVQPFQRRFESFFFWCRGTILPLFPFFLNWWSSRHGAET